MCARRLFSGSRAGLGFASCGGAGLGFATGSGSFVGLGGAASGSAGSSRAAVSRSFSGRRAIGGAAHARSGPRRQRQAAHDSEHAGQFGLLHCNPLFLCKSFGAEIINTPICPAPAADQAPAATDVRR